MLCVIGCVIVKNESANITTTLDSFRDVVNHWIISDTGSDDDTVVLVEQWLEDNKRNGVVVSHKWVDFSTNRNHTLELAVAYAKDHPKLKCYSLVIDSGDSCENPLQLQRVLRRSTSDAISIPVRVINVSQWLIDENISQTRCFRSQLYPRLQYRWGVHESLANLSSVTIEIIVGGFCFIHDYVKDKPSDWRYERDLAILEKELHEVLAGNLTSRDDEEHAFKYTAQTLNNLGRSNEAVALTNIWLKKARSRNNVFYDIMIMCLRVSYGKFSNISHIDELYELAEDEHLNIDDLPILRRIATAYFIKHLKDSRFYAFEMLAKIATEKQMIGILEDALAKIKNHNIEAGVSQ